MDKINYTYQLDFSVRDYELDLQGIVNNAVYQNYLEHTRHEYLKSKGLDFNLLHQEGFDPVVVRSEIDYKKPLGSGDHFVVKIAVERVGRLKILFHQQILRTDDQAIILNAKIFTACIYNGKPIEPMLILEKMGLLS